MLLNASSELLIRLIFLNAVIFDPAKIAMGSFPYILLYLFIAAYLNLSQSLSIALLNITSIPQIFPDKLVNIMIYSFRIMDVKISDVFVHNVIASYVSKHLLMTFTRHLNSI